MIFTECVSRLIHLLCLLKAMQSFGKLSNKVYIFKPYHLHTMVFGPILKKHPVFS